MTKVTIYRKNGNISGYRASGHSGYSEHGSDIVCAALSTALQLPLLSMKKLLKININFKMDEKGFLEVDLREIDKINFEKLNLSLETMVLFIKDLSKQYPKNIKLVEKEEK